ncbi:hypothetical protein KUTeg_008160 [Tegillarca granosa]|uniref:Uncharacterized protein n=1 Tax=Tegillarca granosa TaxID=220873 RepID=A0ABQ9F8B6_TEGGR|nr:hypothetical protein KUTeg_008160 [Tegillarca granosa]
MAAWSIRKTPPDILRSQLVNRLFWGHYEGGVAIFLVLHKNTYTPRSMPAASPNTTSSQSSNQSQSGEQLSRTNLYIRGLNPNTTDKDLVSGNI